MDNISTYLKWRGDLTLKDAPFNEIDALILCELSYIRLDGIAPGIGEGEITIGEAAKAYQVTKDRKVLYYAQKEACFLEMAKAPRFANLTISNYESITDIQSKKQFAAMQIKLGPRTYFVAYRGTDESMVGWREDFDMSYMMPVPAQEHAVEYLRATAKDRYGKYYLGGHSKGGNLAIYAGVFCGERIQKKILKIFSFDGPGFQRDMTCEETYQAIEERIISYVPTASVVGLLMEHHENYKVVQSSGIPLRQHEGFTWQLDGPSFALTEETTRFSKRLSTTITEWNQQVPLDERREMVDSIFDAFESVGIHSVLDLTQMEVRKAAALLRALSKASFAHKDRAITFIKMLIREGKTMVPEQPKEKSNKKRIR